jgi:hypothetical protein
MLLCIIRVLKTVLLLMTCFTCHQVKVQLNGDYGESVAALAQELSAKSGGQLLGIQGRRMLFVPATATKEQLLASAAEQKAKTARWDKDILTTNIHVWLHGGRVCVMARAPAETCCQWPC